MKKIIAASIIALSSGHAVAQDTQPRPTGDGSWYYTMGGGDPYTNYRQSNRTNLSLGAGARWSLFQSCQFDPRLSISETFSDIQSNVYGLSQAVLTSAQLAVQSWGLSKVQENFPGLYDFLMKGLADAKDSYQIAVKSCQDYNRDIEEGRNPVDGWINTGVRKQWAESEESGENPVRAEQEMKERAANAGVTWVNGEQRGGENQDPIETVADTITAGFDHITGGSDDSESSSDQSARITSTFEDSEEAARWITSVVGERQIRTCADCEKLRTRVGQGLRAPHLEEKRHVFETLVDAVNAPGIPAIEDLEALSVPNMGIHISSEVIQALRAEKEINRGIIINRLSSEIALSRVMEKALVSRDLLKMGSQEPNIAANEQAQKELDVARKNLNEEIDNVLYENNIRSQLLTNTAGMLTERNRARTQDPTLRIQMQDERPVGRLRDGGIELDE